MSTKGDSKMKGFKLLGFKIKFNRYENLTEEIYTTYSDNYKTNIKQIRSNAVNLKALYESKYEELIHLKQDLLLIRHEIKKLELEIENGEDFLKTTEYYINDNKKQIQMYSEMRRTADDLCQYLNVDDNNLLIDEKINNNRANIIFYKSRAMEKNDECSKAQLNLRNKQKKHNEIVDKINKLQKEMKKIRENIKICNKDLDGIYIAKKYLDNAYSADVNCPSLIRLSYINPKIKSLKNEQKKEKTKQKSKK